MYNDFHDELKKQLQETGIVAYDEVIEILNAFQIASGQGFAIGKTRALLDFIKEGHSLNISNFNNAKENKYIYSANELRQIYKDIDTNIDLSVEKDFIEYFS